MVTTAVMVLAIGLGCSVQSFVAKMALKHVAKKAYHGVRNLHKKQKSAKAREETRETPRHQQEQSKRTQKDTPPDNETQE